MIVSPIEEFKPIPIRRGEGALSRAAFALRTLIDLQLLTCIHFLKPQLSAMQGKVLDVGCGEMPFRGLLGKNASYTGIDVPVADDFGMSKHPDIVPFDGQTIPFEDSSFDHVICTEVLEHVEDPGSLIAEMNRVLRPGGTMVVTVPFSARVHHSPHDYHRYTCFRLHSLFEPVGDPKIQERGDDLAVIANKLVVISMRLTMPAKSFLWRFPLLLLLIPMTLFALVIAHLSLWFKWGSKADPLGYGIRITKI